MRERGGTPASISDAIQSYLNTSKIGPRIEQAEVSNEWARIVGAQIAAVTDVRGVTREGTLLVYVLTNAWMTELSLREPEISAAIRARLPDANIAKIRWLLQR